MTVYTEDYQSQIDLFDYLSVLFWLAVNLEQEARSEVADWLFQYDVIDEYQGKDEDDE